MLKMSNRHDYRSAEEDTYAQNEQSASLPNKKGQCDHTVPSCVHHVSCHSKLSSLTKNGSARNIFIREQGIGGRCTYPQKEIPERHCSTDANAVQLTT